MRETTIERKLRQRAERKGGLALKLAGTSEKGTPDRLILLPGGWVAFAETKTPTGKVEPRQEYMIGLLQRLGFRVAVIITSEDIDRLIGEA